MSDLQKIFVVKEASAVHIKLIEDESKPWRTILSLSSWDAMKLGGELVDAGLSIIEESRVNFASGKTYEPKQGRT